MFSRIVSLVLIVVAVAWVVILVAALARHYAEVVG